MSLREPAFHHIGIACTSMSREERALDTIGYRRAGDVFKDELQGVEGVFLEGSGPRLELLVNLPGRHTLDAWLAHGTRMYHLAYEVDDLERALDDMRTSGAKVVSAPVPAVAFGGRHIAFVMLRTLSLVELISTR